MLKIMYKISSSFWGIIAFAVSAVPAIIGVFPFNTEIKFLLVGISASAVIILVIVKICMSSYTEVPKIEACTVAEARSKLRDAKLRFSSDFIANDTEAITSQKPIAGNIMKKEAIISVEIYSELCREIIEKQTLNITSENYKHLIIPKLNANNEWLNGEIERDITYENGITYRGEYKDGVPNGKGVLTFANENTYDGDFVDGMLTGKGIYTWADGKIYEGDFVDGKRHGKGVYKSTSGSTYNGNFVCDKYQGKGVYTWASGNKYDGDWVDGNRHGKGVLTFADGDKCECYYVDGLRNGHFTHYYNDGKYDIGTYKDGERHGTFLCYDEAGQLLREEKYENGKRK
ncbi:MAG: hypothetical protein FWH04_05225 [Oscillospiraceae bacterium]|nr:hypothetical protein [Oscillospiraceae bacterium]